ncbi:hypothetical protein BDZ91DRAFT_718040 [Kalaharituber pfeilii]|nr:hypothetical protein BDZ91DRAFT_718040 [Kalaharituber pfeilii]
MRVSKSFDFSKSKVVTDLTPLSTLPYVSELFSSLSNPLFNPRPFWLYRLYGLYIIPFVLFFRS